MQLQSRDRKSFEIILACKNSIPLSWARWLNGDKYGKKCFVLYRISQTHNFCYYAVVHTRTKITVVTKLQRNTAFSANFSNSMFLTNLYKSQILKIFGTFFSVRLCALYMKILVNYKDFYHVWYKCIGWENWKPS